MEGANQKSRDLRKWALWTVLVLCVAGATLALYSTTLTFRVQKSGLEDPGACTINDWFSCDVVHATTFARFLGIPVAWWGFLFYLWTGIMVLIAAVRKSSEQAQAGVAATLVLSAGAVVFSLYKAYHLALLETLCLVCGAMYIINVAIFALLAKALGFGKGQLRRFFPAYFKVLFGKAANLGFQPQPVFYAALIVAFFSLGYISIDSYEEKRVLPINDMMAQALKAHFAQSPINVQPDPAAAMWGNPEAPITIIEFSDFQCPACRDAAFLFKPALYEFREYVRLYFMNYPLDKAINPYTRRGIHPQAGLAARAGVCAQKFGDFWGYHDELFRNQKKFSRQLFLRMGEARKWNLQDFEACLDAESTFERVRRDIEYAYQVRVQATPTIYINGRHFRGWRSPEFIRMVIREELKRLGKS